MSLRHFALLSSLILSLYLSVMGCCDPSAIRVRVRNLDGTCSLAVDWDGPTAPGVYVAQPGIDVPRVAGGADFDGIVFWGLDTTTFPDMIAGPVEYDQPAERSRDTELARHKAPIYPTPLDTVYNPDQGFLDDLAAEVTAMNEEIDMAGRTRLPNWVFDEAGAPVLQAGAPIPVEVTVVTIPGTIKLAMPDDAAGNGPLECPAVPGDEEIFGSLPRHFGSDEQAQ